MSKQPDALVIMEVDGMTPKGCPFFSTNRCSVYFHGGPTEFYVGDLSAFVRVPGSCAGLGPPDSAEPGSSAPVGPVGRWCHDLSGTAGLPGGSWLDRQSGLAVPSDRSYLGDLTFSSWG